MHEGHRRHGLTRTLGQALTLCPEADQVTKCPDRAPCRGSRPTRAFRVPTLRRCLAGPRGWSQAAWSHQVAPATTADRNTAVPQSDGEGVSAAADPAPRHTKYPCRKRCHESRRQAEEPTLFRASAAGARIHACADQKRKFTSRPNQSASTRSARPSTLPRQSAHESSSGCHSTE